MKTKIIRLLFSIYCLMLTFNCFSQNWLWTNNGGSPNGSEGTSICTDNNNVFVSGQIMFPLAYFKSDTLTVNGFDDIFFAKYDASGNELWVKRFGGNNATGNSEAYNWLLYDSISNSVFMIGRFIGSCTFGTFNLLATSNSDAQIFIAKFDLEGNCIWAKSAGGNGNDACKGMAMDQNGNILISGYISSGGIFDTVNIISGGFLAKYSGSGNCLWAKHIVDGGAPHSIKIYNSDIFMLGATADNIVIIDTLSISEQNTYYGKFLARFDSTGNVKWAKLMGGPHNSGGWDLSMDNRGNCYFAGGFRKGAAIFGDSTIHNDTTDFYIVKYDRDGSFKWLSQGHTTLGGIGISVCSDASGNTYLLGGFSGDGNFGNINITSSTTNDLFVARYDSIGNCLGVENIGPAGGSSVTSDINANAYVTGAFSGSISFGTSTLESHGSTDMFVGKISSITGLNEKNTNTNTNTTLVIYANPTTGKCNIVVPTEFLNTNNLLLSIFDNSGRIIQQQSLDMIENNIKLNLEKEAKGIYNVTLSDGKKLYKGKIVFE